jgi:radial spoke head protein 9
VIVSGNGTSNLVFIDADLLCKVKIPAKGLTELDRLAYVVQQIDCDCQIVPRGAIKKTPLEETRRNEAFKGLKADEACITSNYFHFRSPLLKKNVDLNARREGIYNHDFLDNADEDVPKGSWSVLKDSMGTLAILRSKVWPGYYAFHKCNSDIYGGFYVGNGVKALDIAFMF